jgi:hypothetical protein
MPLVITKTHPFRVDFFPRPQLAGAEFAVAKATYEKSVVT